MGQELLLARSVREVSVRLSVLMRLASGWGFPGRGRLAFFFFFLFEEAKEVSLLVCLEFTVQGPGI